MRFLLLLSLAVFVSSCDMVTPPPTLKDTPESAASLRLTPTTFANLPAWGNDDFQGFAQAFSRSCNRIMKRGSDQKFGVLAEAGTYGDWQNICHNFQSVDHNNTTAMRRFFEQSFRPHLVNAGHNPDGLFTGYYEASLKGSRTKTARYNIPLHTRPADLVMVQLGDFREALKGERIAGRVQNGRLKPYESREKIVAGQWPHDDKVLVWVDSAVDAFFVQIQGSGIVQLDDGSTMRIGYAGQNGHPYYAIGRELIKRGALTKQNVSMQSIRAWLEANPHRADEIMNTNRSYVFFTEIKGAGPVGAEGIPLTAQRSLAVDRTLISYGLPLWVDIAPPTPQHATLQRMMVAQDTGGAIRGAVRGDVFWGYGDAAEYVAGKMKSQGRYWVMLPR